MIEEEDMIENEVETDTTSVRELGNKALSLVIKRESNIEIIENEIHNYLCEIGVGENEYEDKYKELVSQVVYDIRRKIPLSEIQANLKKGCVFWKHTFYDKARFEEYEQDNFILQPFEIEEGVLECRCGSKRVYSYQKQSRSSDEPMSTYAQCMACKAKWVYSG